MEIDSVVIKEKLKALPRPLKIVALVILGDLLLIGAALVALDEQVSVDQARSDQLRGQLTQLRRQNNDLRTQVAHYPDLLKHYDEAVAKGMLTPLDRIKLVNEVQDSAASHQIANLHYKLEDEDIKADPKERLHLVSTRVILENSGLLDTDTLSFWDDVLAAVPAHYQVLEASLERSRDPDAVALGEIRNGRTLPLLNAKISFRAASLQKPVQEGP